MVDVAVAKKHPSKESLILINSDLYIVAELNVR